MGNDQRISAEPVPSALIASPLCQRIPSSPPAMRLLRLKGFFGWLFGLGFLNGGMVFFPASWPVHGLSSPFQLLLFRLLGRRGFSRPPACLRQGAAGWSQCPCCSVAHRAEAGRPGPLALWAGQGFFYRLNTWGESALALSLFSSFVNFFCYFGGHG